MLLNQGALDDPAGEDADDPRRSADWWHPALDRGLGVLLISCPICSALAFNNRGYVLDLSGELERALADHNRAIELDPSYEKAFRDRASIRRRLGMNELAQMDLAHAEALCGTRDETEIERSKLV